mmetsp:Transcript_5121/g.11633  ORF Transcript_5121/g.11633 Transcript_5121/m.11633 type:complete len:130 (+) Transcript_5121:64-453(+)
MSNIQSINPTMHRSVYLSAHRSVHPPTINASNDSSSKIQRCLRSSTEPANDTSIQPPSHIEYGSSSSWIDDPGEYSHFCFLHVNNLRVYDNGIVILKNHTDVVVINSSNTHNVVTAVHRMSTNALMPSI